MLILKSFNKKGALFSASCFPSIPSRLLFLNNPSLYVGFVVNISLCVSGILYLTSTASFLPATSNAFPIPKTKLNRVQGYTFNFVSRLYEGSIIVFSKTKFW